MWKVLALMLLTAPAMAGTVKLNAPAYPWQPGVGHSNVTHAFVLGFDSSGNPEGICTYYNFRGFPVYAYCGWDLSGQPVYATPAALTPYQVSQLETYGEPIAGGWLQAAENGYSVILSDITHPPTSELVAP